MPKIMAMRADENTAIKALLTDDQKAKYDAILPRCRSAALAPAAAAEHHLHLLHRHLHSNCGAGFDRRAGEPDDSPAFLRGGTLHGTRV